jgi:ferredoxin--NADP+ reductase
MAISVKNDPMAVHEVQVSKTELNAIVTQRHDLGKGVWVIYVTPDGWSLPRFEAGQYATLGLPGSAPRRNGAEPEPAIKDPEKLIKRAYSIVSSPIEDDHLEFYLVLISNGTLTPRLFHLQPGDRLWLSPKIIGTFVLSRAPENVNLVFVATGTGVAPYVSMLRTILGPKTTRNIALLHGVRVSQDLGYMKELMAMQRVCPNFTYVPTISRPQNEVTPWRGRTGYVQDVWESGVLKESWGFSPAPENTHFFLCGSPGMIESMVKLLSKDGFTEHTRAHPTGNVHLERYW